MMRVLLIVLGLGVLIPARSHILEHHSIILNSCTPPRMTCMYKKNHLGTYVSDAVYTCLPPSYTTKTLHDRRFGRIREKAYVVFAPGTANVTLDMSHWTNGTLKVLGVRNCHSVVLKMHTTSRNTVEKLFLSNVDTVHIQPPETSAHKHHPPKLYFENIKSIPEIPTGAICDNSTEQITFKNVAIDSIHQGAFNLHGPIKKFNMTNVTFGTMQGKSVSLKMDPNAQFIISSSNFSTVPSNSISVESALVIIRNCSFSMMQEAALVIKADGVSLSENFFHNLDNALFVEASQIDIRGNEFHDKIQAVKMVKWNGNKIWEGYHQTDFFFVQNFIKSMESTKSACISNSWVFVNDGNCTRRLTITDYFRSKDRPLKVMLFNRLVCGNSFGFEVPSEWFPKTKHEICRGV